MCANLVANPAAGDSELSLELEMAESSEKTIEDVLLDGGEVNCVANLVSRHWCACRDVKRRRNGS